MKLCRLNFQKLHRAIFFQFPNHLSSLVSELVLIFRILYNNLLSYDTILRFQAKLFTMENVSKLYHEYAKNNI